MKVHKKLWKVHWLVMKMTEITQKNGSHSIQAQDINPILNKVNNEIIQFKKLEDNDFVKDAFNYSIGTKKLNEVLIPEKLSKLTNLYTLKEFEEVFDYLESYSYLITLLEEAYFEIRRYFSNEKLTLEVMNDMETNEEMLLLLINTNLNQKEARQKLNRFDENWWIDASLFAFSKLCIQVEF